MGSQTTGVARRHLGAVTAAIVTVAVVLGVAVLTSGDSGSPSASAGPRPEPTVLGEQTLDIDLGAVTDPDVIGSCLAPSFASDVSEVDVLYGVEQRTADGSAPVLLLRNADGDLRLCDAAGPDSPAQLPVPTPTDAEPVAHLSNGRAAWECTGRTLDGYTATSWLAVGPQVDRVQQRFLVDGAAGPWFTTRARGGYAHLQTWLDGPLRKGTAIAVQHRVLDAAGEPVAQSTLRTARQPLAGCAGGDAQIG